MGEYLLADEQSCVSLPDALSYMDGAHIACGGGTAYEALLRANLNGNDRVSITPVGLSVGMIAQALGVKQVIGIDLSEERVKIAHKIGAITDGISASGSEAESFIRDKTNNELCEAAFDCSGRTTAASGGVISGHVRRQSRAGNRQ
jgi:D-arabinose 1-dehydrogenase-like Zn-dependent alcohol dehydrogenase